MKKFKEFCKKPITWGDYFKLCKWSAILSLVSGAGFMALGKIEDLRWQKAMKEREQSMFDDSFRSTEDEAN